MVNSPPYLIGLGFIQAWLWLFFLNGPLLYAALNGSANRAEMVFILFMLFHALTFLSIAVKKDGWSQRLNRPVALSLSALAASGGPLLVHFLAGTPSAAAGNGIVIVTTIIAGIGGAVMVAAWGDDFSRQPANINAVGYGGAVIVGTALFFIAVNVPPAVSPFLLALLPWMSLVFLRLNGRRSESTITARFDIGDQTAKTGVSIKSAFPFPKKLTGLIVVVYLIGGLIYKIVYLTAKSPATETFWLTSAIYAIVALAGGLAISKMGVDLRNACRPVLPLLGAAFVLFPLFNQTVSLIPFIMFQAGFALFDLYTWVLFAYLAADDPFPTRIFGGGLFLITASIFAGELFSTTLLPTLTAIGKQVNIVSMAGALIMLASTVIFTDRSETFAGWAITGTRPSSLNGQVDEEINGSVYARQVSLDKEQDAKFTTTHKLTQREAEILSLLIGGRNNPHIREQLNISNNTLKSHLKNLYGKCAVGNRQELLTLYSAFAEESHEHSHA